LGVSLLSLVDYYGCDGCTEQKAVDGATKEGIETNYPRSDVKRMEYG